MKKLQIPLGLATIVAGCCVLFMGSSKPSASQKTVAPIAQLEPKLSPAEIALYNEKKQAVEKIVIDYFKEAKAKGDFVGAGIAIVQGDSIMYVDGAGLKSISGNDTVNAHTAFRLGSLSKGFAGVLSAAVKQEGLINWDDPVNEYISDFQLGSIKPSAITIEHILSHSAGTPYHSYTDLVEAGVALSDIAPRFKSVKAITAPGKTYSYQNAMFALSALVVEKATKSSFDEVIQKRFFKPLGMEDATTNCKDFQKLGNIAMPHRKTKYSYRSLPINGKYDNAIAAGGINASSTDMAKWMRFLLGHNPEVLEPQAIQAAFEPKVEIRGKSKYYQRWEGHKSSYYGFGWRIHNFEDRTTHLASTMIHHGGSVNDFRNEIALFPNEDLGICVLFNSNTLLSQRVIPDLHKLIKESFAKIEANKTTSSMAALKGKEDSNG